MIIRPTLPETPNYTTPRGTITFFGETSTGETDAAF